MDQQPLPPHTSMPMPPPPGQPTPPDPLLKYVIPIGRSGWAIAAGYVALFAILVFPAPLALILGIVALVDIHNHPQKMGRGRAWFAVIFGGLMTLLLLAVMASAAR